MRPRDWMRLLWGEASLAKGRRRKGWDAGELVPRLTVKRLEERRVLNADAAPVEVLVVDAGDSGGDGQADSYYVEQDAEAVRISLNGQEVAAAPIANVNEIRIRGSADDDVLVADLLAGVNLVFDGGSGDDQLVMTGDQPYDQVAYEIGPDGSARIAASGASGELEINVTGVEQIRDARAAKIISFDMVGDSSRVAIDAGNASGTSSTLLVDGPQQLEIEFENPSDVLRVDTASDGQEGTGDAPDRVELAGLGSQFDADLRITGSVDDSLYVLGETDLGAGGLSAASGSIVVEQSLRSGGATVELSATDSLVFAESGHLDIDGGDVRLDASNIEVHGGIVARGGDVVLDSGDEGITTLYGWIDVSNVADNGVGGNVHLLGAAVGLMASARVQASGVAGGGAVLVGGDYQGNNSNVRNASRTYVAPSASITANALSHGDGGKIIVWADDWTRFAGTITARGGALGGDGGFVETSGKILLEATGSVRADAPAGQAGTWLLDPRDVELRQINPNPPDSSVRGSFSGGSPNIFVPLDAASALVAEADIFEIIESLEAGTNVEITTVAPLATGNGDITVVDSIDIDLSTTAGAQPVTFTLTAQGNIIVDDAISLTGADDSGDRLSLAFNALGNVQINAAIVTGGGDVDIDAVTGITSDAAGTITTTAAADSGAASGTVNLSVTGIGDITLAGDIVTDGADQSATTMMPASSAGQVDIATFQGAITLASIDSSGGAHAGGNAGDDGGDAAAIQVTAGDAGAAGDFDITLNETLTALTGTAAGGGTAGAAATVTLIADNSLVDGSNPLVNIVANAAVLSASGQIGDLAGAGDGNVSQDPANPFETDVAILTVSDAVEIAITNAAAGGLSVSNIAPGGAAAGQAVITSGGDLTIAAHALTNGDGIGYVSGDTLTIPDAAIDVGNNGRIRFQATVDVADATDSTLSNNLFRAGIYDLFSGSPEDLNLQVVNLRAEITGAGDLTVTEVNNIKLIDVRTFDGNINVTAGNSIQVRNVVDGAGTNIVTLDAVNNIVDDNGGVNNITALTANLIAGGQIGDLDGDVLAAPIDALETAVSNLSVADAVETAIENVAAGGLTVTNLTPGGVAAGAALISSDNDLTVAAHTLTAGDSIGYVSGGTLTIPDAAINLGAGRLRLEADTDIEDAGDSTLSNNLYTASDAVISSGAGESLDLSVDSLVAEITGAGDLTVAEANAITLIDIATLNGNIDISSGGNMAVRRVNDQALANTVTLISGGAITDDNAGALNVSTDALALTASGAIGATGGTNPLDIDVTTLTADTSLSGGSGIFINETDDVDIGLGNVATLGGDFELTAGGTISSSVGADIVTTAAANTGDPSGSVRIVATGTAGISLSGAIETSGADDNDAAGTAGDGGDVDISTTNAAVEVAAITASGGAGVAGNASGGASGNVSVAAGGNGSLSLNGVVSALGGTASGAGLVGGNGNVTLNSDAGGNVSQDAGQEILTGGLEILGGGAVVLEDPDNDLQTLAGNTTNTISLRDTDGFTLDAVGSTNDLTSTDDITLRAAGDVVQAGINGELFADGLELLGTGSFTLTQTGNNVNVLAANLTGLAQPVSFADANSFDVGTVNTVGVTTRGGAVTLSGVSGLTSSQDIATQAATNSGAVSGAVDLDVTGVGNIVLSGNVVATGAARTLTSATAASDAGQVNVNTFQGAITLANVDASGGDHSGAAAGDDGGQAAAINVTVGDAGAAGDFDLTLNGLLDATAGSAAGAAANGNANSVTLTVDNDIIDGNAGGLNIAGEAAAILTAAGQIGDLAGPGNGDVSLDPTDPLETAVDSLTVNNAIETAIANAAPAGLAIANIAPGGAAPGAALITNDGDVTVAAHTLTAGDSIGYVLSAGTLEIPDASIDVGMGRIRFEAPVDVRDANDSILNNNGLTFTAGDFIISSGAGESLNLDVDTLVAHITGMGNLSVVEVDRIELVDVDTVDGNINVTAVLGDILVGSVEDLADHNVVMANHVITLTAVDGAIDNLNPADGTANVVGDFIVLSADNGGIGQNEIVEVDASRALDANTAADGSNITIASITDLPARAINAGGGNVTLTSTGAIDNNAAANGAANIIGNIIDLAADAGGIGQANVLEVAAATALDADATNDGSGISIDSIGALPARDINAVGIMVAGDVTLTSTTTIDNDAAADGVANVRGSVVDLSATLGGIGQNIALEIASATEFNAVTTADGSGIAIDSIGDLPVGNVNAIEGGVPDAGMTEGVVVIDSTGAIDNAAAADGIANILADVITVTASAGGIGQSNVLEVDASTALDADAAADDGDIAIDSITALPARLINAGLGEVVLTATTAIDNDAATDGAANVIGGVIDLTATLGGIGQNNTLEVDAGVALDANTTADGANIDIDSITNLPARAINAGAGEVTLTSTTTINNDAATDGAANIIGGIIDLTATLGGIGQNNALEVDADAALDADAAADSGNIAIDSITALPAREINAAAGDVLLTATTTIDNNAAPDGTANIIGGVIDLAAAAGGIGQNNTLEVDADAALDADTTADDGNIAIDSITALPAREVNAAAGDVVLTATTTIDNDAAPDGAANVIGGVIDLTATLGGIGQNNTLEVDADAALDANTTADGSNIDVDSITNLPARAINAAAGNVVLSATTSINNDAATDGAANIIGSEIELAAAAGGIGQTNALELDAATALDADTTTDDGDIAIDSITALPARTINAAGGEVVLTATTTIDNNAAPDGTANITGDVIDLTADAGGIGQLSVLEVDAETALDANSAADGGDISMNSITSLPARAINAATGTVTLDSTSGITDANAGEGLGSENIIGGLASLTAASIGMGGMAGDELDTAVDTIEADASAGGIFLRDVDSLEIVGTGASAAARVQIATETGALVASQPVTSAASSVGLSGGETAQLNANVSALAGQVVVGAGTKAIDSIGIGPGVTIESVGGAISDDILRFNLSGSGPRFDALDGSLPDGIPLLVGQGSPATITIDIFEANPTANFLVGIDWREENGVLTPLGAFPDGVTPENIDLMVDEEARIVEVTVNGAVLQVDVTHNYFGHPDGITSPTIFVPVRISQIAGDMIRFEVGVDDGNAANGPEVENLLEFAQDPGTLGANLGMTLDLDGLPGADPQRGIMTVLALDVTPGLPAFVPLPEALPVTTLGPEPLPIVAAPTPPLAQIATAPPLPNTAGLTAQAEIRYYELRVVSFNRDGKMVETPEERIDLSDERLLAIAPFSPSKLPQLFTTLTGDRFRIYLIDDGAERLILDFVIERVGDEARPIELPEAINENDNGDELLDQPLKVPQDVPTGEDETRSAGTGVGVTPQRPESAPNLDRASLMSTGGLFYGSVVLSETARRRRVRRADQRMAAFRRQHRNGSSWRSHGDTRPPGERRREHGDEPPKLTKDLPNDSDHNPAL